MEVGMRSEFLIFGALYFNQVGTFITMTATRTAHRLRYRNVQSIRRARRASSREFLSNYLDIFFCASRRGRLP